MVMEEGEKLRIRAREAAMIFGDQNLHQSYIDELVKVLDRWDCKGEVITMSMVDKKVSIICSKERIRVYFSKNVLKKITYQIFF